MSILPRLSLFFKTYLPMFLMICFSGNPIITHMWYSNSLLVVYSMSLSIYVFYGIDQQMFRKATGVFIALIALIFLLAFFQKVILDFISFPGIFGYILKIILSLSTLLYYQKNKIDFIDTFIRTMAFLGIVSIPFWILNQFGFYGIATDGATRKSFLLYTSLRNSSGRLFVRNSGMFWEPGAFAGYLLLGMVFIALKNRKFQIGPNIKEIILLLIGLITTMSTTGFIVFGTILIIYALQNYNYGKLIVIPLIFLFLNFIYFKLDFMKDKIEYQYSIATSMDENDVDPSRFGALVMDIQYIKSQPLIGNGLHVKTRYRFHPFIKGDIGHGNGMSNIMAIWGIPFFLLWLICCYSFFRKISHSFNTAIAALFLVLLLLQGEQFLNFPIYLSFFFLPFIYKNIRSAENKIHILKVHYNIQISKLESNK